jgi:hypothetical protein
MYSSASIAVLSWPGVREGSQDARAVSRADPDPVRAVERLHGLASRLRLVMAVVQVCVAALRQQNADCDVEVAQVLQRHAGDRLDVEIEQLEKLIRLLERAVSARTG